MELSIDDVIKRVEDEKAPELFANGPQQLRDTKWFNKGLDKAIEVLRGAPPSGWIAAIEPHMSGTGSAPGVGYFFCPYLEEDTSAEGQPIKEQSHA